LWIADALLLQRDFAVDGMGARNELVITAAQF
jgi:hypothetical protein